MRRSVKLVPSFKQMHYKFWSQHRPGGIENRKKKTKNKKQKKKTGQARKARPLISTDNEKIETNCIYKYKKNKTKQLWCFPYSVFFLELQS